MRKLALLLCALCLLQFSHAQLSLGVKAGINISTATIPDYGSEKWRSGVNAGLFAHVSPANKLFIQPELLYSLKGYALEADQFNPKGSVAFHYIALPLLAGFHVTDNLSMVIGPEFGYMLSARSKWDDGVSHDISQNFKEVDFGIDLGATYKVNDMLGIDIRYNHGLKKLVGGVRTDQFGQVTGKWEGVSNRVFQASVTYRLSRK